VSKDALGYLEITITSSSTSAHDNKRMQEWLKENLTEVLEEEVWPTSSPHCNSFRYFYFFEWGESELWANAKPGNKTKNMIQKIKEVMGSFTRA
jgi:hypothetical protein